MVVGLVGGVGCGKSTVLSYLLDKYDAYIIEADKVAKEIRDSQNVLKKIAEIFPTVIKDGSIDNESLANIVFNDAKKRKMLENIIHPETINEINNRIDNSDNKLVIVESAILIGTGIEDKCDEIWYVFCEKEERIRRLELNRGYSRDKALSIIENQMSDEEFNSISDEFIDNSGASERTKEQIDFILNSQFC